MKPRQFEKLIAIRKKFAHEKKMQEQENKKKLSKVKLKRQKAKGNHREWQKEQSAIHNCKYKEFLKSKYWKQVKKLILKRDGYKCTVCESPIQLEIHHTTYKHHKKEHKHLEDLLTLCHTCHHDFHLVCEVDK